VKIIDRIRRNTGLKALNKNFRSVKRNKFVHNLTSAHKLALVGIVNSNKDFEDVLNLQKLLITKNMQVDVLVYFPGKEIPQQLLLRKGINIFKRTEINWFGKPLIPFAEQFCKVEYDILIDLSLFEIFPIRWISTLSRAMFKVGALGYPGNPYELIINVDNRKEISFLSEQIIHYLTLLNNRSAQEKDFYSDSDDFKNNEINQQNVQ
jgi:hypothetical protein